MAKTAIILFIIFFGCKIENTFLSKIGHISLLNQNYFGIDLNNNIIIYNGNSIVINNNSLTIGDYIFDIETTDEILSKDFLLFQLFNGIWAGIRLWLQSLFAVIVIHLLIKIKDNTEK